MFWCNSFHFSFSPHLKWRSLRFTKSMQRASRIVETWVEFCLPAVVPAAFAPMLKGRPRWNTMAEAPLNLSRSAYRRYSCVKTFPHWDAVSPTSPRKLFRDKKMEHLRLCMCSKKWSELIMNHILNTFKEGWSCGAPESLTSRSPQTSWKKDVHLLGLCQPTVHLSRRELTLSQPTPPWRGCQLLYATYFRTNTLSQANKIILGERVIEQSVMFLSLLL